MNLYSYDGPVMEFDRLIAEDWHGQTWAVSAAKAQSNLAYQFKKQNNRVAGTNIKLPGKIILMEKGVDYGTY